LERVFIDRYATIGLLLLIRWIAGRNYADQGQEDKISGSHSSRRLRPRRRSAYLKDSFPFRNDSLIAMKVSAKIQHGLLVRGDAHSVQKNMYFAATSSRSTPFLVFVCPASPQNSAQNMC
jgi:hypothetical protein